MTFLHMVMFVARARLVSWLANGAVNQTCLKRLEQDEMFHFHHSLQRI